MKKSKVQYASMAKHEKIFGTFLLLVYLAMPWLAALGNTLLPTPLSTGTRTFSALCICAVLTILVFHRFIGSSLRAAWCDLWNLLQALVLGFVACWVCLKAFDWLCSLLFSGYSALLGSTLSALSGENAYLRIIGAVFLLPLTEELLCRGLVFRGVWRKSRIWAYILSMLLFSVMQILGYTGGTGLPTILAVFARYLPMGLCLCWTYSKADNVVASFVIHAIFNALFFGLV